MNRDEEVRDVVATIDGLLDALRSNVDALNAILTPPASDGQSGQEVPA